MYDFSCYLSNTVYPYKVFGKLALKKKKEKKMDMPNHARNIQFPYSEWKINVLYTKAFSLLGCTDIFIVTSNKKFNSVKIQDVCKVPYIGAMFASTTLVVREWMVVDEQLAHYQSFLIC